LGHDPVFFAIVLVLALFLVLVLDCRSKLFARMVAGCSWPNIRRRNEDEGDDDDAVRRGR
jgi:hypothetical protein